MLLKFVLLIVGIVLVAGEPPKRAPYPAAGWRPQVPFNLPSDFQPPAGYRVEITKQRVEHAGTFNAPQFNSQYLPPQFDVPQQQQQEEQQSSINKDQQSPADQYGPPADDSFRIVYPEEEEDSASLTQPKSSNIKEGRYYVISPDNKLQRVIYRTEEAQGDEFTAQLKYSPVGELQDPVYKYNSQGQLERVLK
ncbi:uncharacterized protein LOC117571119 [Drosophila albomicans]|uniref:Uncharacterized protein LOC117571119 n=1 Tax=Drosophila albomicans TaxID=7291 RepID=A0A6P8WYZ6_DROAB|nr:uncharacterized protein LOC117571119 [Drosophila albomicans]